MHEEKTIALQEPLLITERVLFAGRPDYCCRDIGTYFTCVRQAKHEFGQC